MNSKRIKLITFILLLIILLYLTFGLKIFNKDNLMDVISLQENSAGFFAIFTVFSSLLIVFFVPLSWLSFFSAYFFGMSGFFSILISATIGSVVSFSISRLFSGKIMSMITKFYNRKERKFDLDYLSGLIEKHGVWYIVYLRNTPFIPFSLTSYIAGSSRISFYSHFLGTVIGLLPSLLLAVYFYSSVMNIANDIKGLIIASVLKVLQIIIVFYLFKRKMN